VLTASGAAEASPVSLGALAAEAGLEASEAALPPTQPPRPNVNEITPTATTTCRINLNPLTVFTCRLAPHESKPSFHGHGNKRKRLEKLSGGRVSGQCSGACTNLYQGSGGGLFYRRGSQQRPRASTDGRSSTLSLRGNSLAQRAIDGKGSACP